MNSSDVVETGWNQLRLQAKQRWPELTDDDLDTVAGSRDELAVLLQKHYGLSHDEAQREIGAWLQDQ